MKLSGVGSRYFLNSYKPGSVLKAAALIHDVEPPETNTDVQAQEKAFLSGESWKLLLKSGEQLLGVGASEVVERALDLGGNRIELGHVDLRGLPSTVEALKPHDLESKKIHFKTKSSNLEPHR